MQDFFAKMKALVEDTYTRTNGQKVVFITHSMGSPNTLYFLNQQPQAWKDKHIKSWVSLAGCWAGTVKALKVYIQGTCQNTLHNVVKQLKTTVYIGDNLGVRVLSETALREQQR